MRKIGTLTAAAGLIFLGIWLMLANFDKSIADQFFNWWPILIIFIGLEILYFLKQNPSGEKPRPSGLFFAVIILFLILNASQNLHSHFEKIFYHHSCSLFENNFDWSNDHYKKVSTSQTLIPNSNDIVISASKGTFHIKKSPDNTLRIEGDVYVDPTSTLSDWKLNPEPNSGEMLLDFKNPDITMASVDIYVPDGASLWINADEVKLNSSKAGISKLSLDCNEGDLNLSNIKTMDIKMQSGNANLHGPSESITMNMDNGKLDLNGNVHQLSITMTDGELDINNTAEQDAHIQLNSGIINYNTHNKDAAVTLSVINGISILDGLKTVGGEINHTYGSGNSRITINLGNGKLSFSNRE
ncbi:MAG: hypothetical protein H6Q67_1284 [Firmicutes bacterium]|nr:hypothetical protein [Bacillota bacterium]